MCDEHGIGHRFTKPAHTWTNGQVERFNRTLKEATVHLSHCQTTDEFNQPLQAFLLACNHGKRLKRLRSKTPHEFICQQWRLNPTIFTRDPTQLTLGLYTWTTSYLSQIFTQIYFRFVHLVGIDPLRHEHDLPKTFGAVP